MPQRPCIAFVTLYDATNCANWSGIPYFLSRHLQALWGDVTFIGSLSDLPRLRWKQQLSQRLAGRGWGKNYLAENDPRLTRHFARQVAQRIKGGQFDLIFSPSTIPIADLDTPLPIITYCDSTFAVMQDFYPEYSNLSDETIRNGYAVERKAAQRATLLIYTSEWSARSMQQAYGATPEHVKVIPFGANLDHVPTAEAVKQRQRREACRLLWLGRDWHRKGGDVAVQILTELKKMNLPATLTICGLIPPVKVLPSNVTVIPYVDKATLEGSEQFKQLMQEHDFLLLPSQADCTPLAVGEVNAYGMPVIARGVGGMYTIVHDSINGFVLPPLATPAAYADKIAMAWDAPEIYRSLAQTSRDTFEVMLNWDVAVHNMMAAFQSL
jgi:glycosyltransferase involved in cell wall biosynthesis